MANTKKNSNKTSLPNQNNISATINSQIADLTDVVEVVVKAINKKPHLYNAKTQVTAKLYSSIVKTLFNENGAIVELCKANNTLAKLQPKKIKTKRLKSSINDVTDLNIYIIKFLAKLNLYNKTINIDDSINIISGIKIAIRNVISVTKLLNSIPIVKHNKTIKKSIGNIFNTSKLVYDLFVELNNFDINILNKKDVSNEIINSINYIATICNEIAATKIVNNSNLKKQRRTIKRSINSIIKIFKTINSIDIEIDDITSSYKKLKVLKLTYIDLITILNSFNNLKLPKRIKTRKIRSITKSILKLNSDLIDFINNINENPISIANNKYADDITTVLTTINKVSELILNYNNKSRKLRRKCLIIKSDIDSIKNFITDLEYLRINKYLLDNVKNKLDILTNVYQEVVNLIDTILNTKTPLPILVKIKLFLILRTISSLITFCFILNILSLFMPIIILAQPMLFVLNYTITLLAIMFNNIASMKLNVKTFIKLKLLHPFLMLLQPILMAINTIALLVAANKSINDAAKIFAVFAFIRQVFICVSDMPWILMKHKLKTLRRNILTLSKVIRNLNLLTINPMVIVNLLVVNVAIIAITAIFIQISLFTPIYIVSCITIWSLVLAVLALKVAVNIICSVLGKLATSPKILLGLLALTIILGLVTALGIALLAMSIIAPPIIKSSLTIIKLLWNITKIAALSIGLGFVVGLSLPILIPALLGLSVLTLLVLAVVSIGIILKGIELLKLDADKIKKNIEIVISTARMVMDSIFNDDSKKHRRRKKGDKDKGEKNGIIGNAISFFGTTIGIALKSSNIAFLIMTTISIFIILIISVQLRLLQILDLDKDKIAMNVDIVISTALNVIDRIFNKDDKNNDKKSKKSWIKNVISTFGGSLSTIIEAIMSVAFLAITLVAITLIMIISVQLRLLQMLNLDEGLILKNVNIVIDTALNVIDSIFNRDDNNNDKKSKKSWIRNVISTFGGSLSTIIEAVMSVAFLAITLVSIALITILANQLSNLSKIELPDNINDKVNSIITAANQVTTALFNRKDENNSSAPDEKKKGFLSKVFSHLGGAVDMIASMGWLSTAMVSVGMVSKLAEHLTTINNVPDVTNIVSKTEAVCNSADMLIKHMTTRPDYGGEVESNSRIDIIDKINQSIQSIGNIEQKQIKKIDKVFDDYSKFIDKVNTVDVAKLENSTKMFAQMANFSNSIKGDFTKLAETLNEHLMPVLQELKEIMGIIPEKLDTGFQNTSASIAATTVAPTQETVTAQVNRENPSMTKKEVDNIVQQRMKDYSKTEATGVVAKLDQLIDLLKGYSGENVMVKTV